MNGQEAFEKTAALMEKEGFTIVEKELKKPWGGYFVIDESQAAQFAARA